MRRNLIGLLALLASTAIACAGDYADHEIIGFSPDGSTFAFEEYGVEDGSGFPYSNTFIIDTATDQWVAETPIRVREENDTRELAGLRADARKQAEPLLRQYGISAKGTVVASNPSTGTSAAPHRVAFAPRLTTPPSPNSMTAELSEIPLPAANCPPQDKAYMGYGLTLTGPSGTRTLNTDKAVPGSRRCPFGYGISEIVIYFPDGGAPAVAIIIDVYSVGFEGPNRRFLAVATRLQE